ncbi:hypothetical protein FRC09_009251 [Ceratobasidium sp. 395]|nr:hypothetical protein FRC09_009251 [Ceratobasidium sp. 395]
MAFTEAGKIHCDISAYNLLLIDATKHYVGSWLKAPKVQASADVWSRTAKGTSVREATDEHMSSRMARVKSLNRGPVCVVHDTEFTVDEDRPEGETHTDRTGTPAFISAQLLAAHMSGESVARTFIHDVESLLWVLIWVVAHHSQKEDTWQINETAREVIQELSQNNWNKLATYKANQLSNTDGLKKTIRRFDNKWSEQIADVIGRLASFLYPYIYISPELATADDDTQMFFANRHEILTTCSRSATFAQLFQIFDAALAKLENDCPPIDGSKL